MTKSGKPLVIVLAIIFLVLCITLLSIPFWRGMHNSLLEDEKHDYVECVVQEKDKNTNHFWFFWSSTDFVIISKDKEGTVWTSHVSEDYWYSKNVGDTIIICKKHQKIKDI